MASITDDYEFRAVRYRPMGGKAARVADGHLATESEGGAKDEEGSVNFALAWLFL